MDGLKFYDKIFLMNKKTFVLKSPYNALSAYDFRIFRPVCRTALRKHS